MNTTRHLSMPGVVDPVIPVNSVTKTLIATPVGDAWALIGHTRLGRVAVVIGDLLGAVGVALCIPLAILAIGAPVALCVRVLLWIAGRV